MFSLIEKVYAQDEVPVEVTDPLERVTNLGGAFNLVLNLLMAVGWALVFVMLVLGFIQYIMSKGEKQAVDSAQKWLTYAVIGGVGLFLIVAIRRILPALLGSDITPGGPVIWGDEGGGGGGGGIGEPPAVVPD